MFGSAAFSIAHGRRGRSDPRPVHLARMLTGSLRARHDKPAAAAAATSSVVTPRSILTSAHGAIFERRSTRSR